MLNVQYGTRLTASLGKTCTHINFDLNWLSNAMTHVHHLLHLDILWQTENGRGSAKSLSMLSRVESLSMLSRVQSLRMLSRVESLNTAVEQLPHRYASTDPSFALAPP